MAHGMHPVPEARTADGLTAAEMLAKNMWMAQTRLVDKPVALTWRPSYFPSGLGLPLPRLAGICEQAYPGVLFVEATYRHLF